MFKSQATRGLSSAAIRTRLSRLLQPVSADPRAGKIVCGSLAQAMEVVRAAPIMAKPTLVRVNGEWLVGDIS